MFPFKAYDLTSTSVRLRFPITADMQSKKTSNSKIRRYQLVQGFEEAQQTSYVCKDTEFSLTFDVSIRVILFFEIWSDPKTVQGSDF